MRYPLAAVCCTLFTLPAQGPSADAKALAAACNQFATALQGRLASDGPPTCSPGSIAIALWLLLPGARGDTATQLADVLQLPAGLRGERLAVAAGELLRASRLGATEPTGPAAEADATRLELVNDAFVQKGFPLVPAYPRLLAERFGARLTELDFFADADAARTAINTHIAKVTHDRIQDLLQGDDIGRDTRLVLTNALWCKGPWAQAFPDHATRVAKFTRADGQAVEVPTMHLGESLPWVEGPAFFGVSLPLAGGELVVDLVLPPVGQPLAAAEVALLDGSFSKAKVTPVQVALPKFTVGSKVRLREVLQAMGVTDAFTSGKADFSGIDPKNSLVVHDVVHQAWAAADEAGFEAAAATAVILKRGAPRLKNPKLFTADRPFGFALRDLRSGLVWFVGRVEDPSAKPW